MRTTAASVAILALFGVAMTTPASAMCGGGQQAQASGKATGGMMCSPSPAAAQEPKADQPTDKSKSSGMCPCCRNMAMMKGGSSGGMHHMPGMDMPKQ